MTTTADRHRALDRAAAVAMGEAPGHALVPSRHRGRASRTLNAEGRPTWKLFLAERQPRKEER